MKNTFHSRLLPVGVSLTLLTGVLAGCGGSGGTAALRPAAVTLNGTLLDSSSVPMSGYTVVYTRGGAQPAARVSPHVPTTVLTTVTDSQGHYTLVIPAAQITGHDSLAFYDATGVFAQTQSLTLSTTQTGTVTVPQSVVTTLPAPPEPPVSAL